MRTLSDKEISTVDGGHGYTYGENFEFSFEYFGFTIRGYCPEIHALLPEGIHVHIEDCSITVSY